MSKESIEQQAFVQWLRVRKITHFAPGNENLHSGIIRQAVKQPGLAGKITSMIENKMKSMGKRKGVSDLVVLLPGAKAIFIEMKRPTGGVISKEQDDWRNEVMALGFDAHVCHGWDTAREIISGYLK